MHVGTAHTHVYTTVLFSSNQGEKKRKSNWSRDADLVSWLSGYVWPVAWKTLLVHILNKQVSIKKSVHQNPL